jgi:hypothetical protein
MLNQSVAAVRAKRVMSVCKLGCQAGHRAFASRVLAAGIILWREKWPLIPTFALPAASQSSPRWFRLVFAVSRPGPTVPPPAGMRVPGSCGLPTKRMVHMSRYAGTHVVPGDGKPPCFCLECRCRPSQTPQLVLLAAFARPRPRCYPWSYRPSLLRLLCPDGTSSAQRTISMVSLHIRTVHGEDAITGGRTALHLTLQRGTAGRGERYSANESCKGTCRIWWAGYPFGGQSGYTRHSTDMHNGTKGGPSQGTVALLHWPKEECLLR